MTDLDSAAPLDAVLWDFGGVFTPSPFLGLRRFASERSVDPDDLFQAIFGPYDRDTDHPWHRLERGEIDIRTAMGEIGPAAAAVGVDVGSDNPLGFLAGIMDDSDRTPVVELVRELGRAGVRQAVVTNNVAEFGDLWRSLIPVDDLFDTVVDSSAEGVRKPDPAIYRLALERLGDVAPERAAFVDDVASNVAAADALGITGVLMPQTDLAPALQTLRRRAGLS